MCTYVNVRTCACMYMCIWVCIYIYMGMYIRPLHKIRESTYIHMYVYGYVSIYVY